MTAAVGEHSAGSGKVRTFDGLVPLKLRHDIYRFCTQASYTIGWEDTDVIEQRQNLYLHASPTQQQLNDLGLLFHLAPTPAFAEVNGMEFVKAVINLSTPSDVYFAHAHPESKVLLYYANLDWRPYWYGETLFFDESLSRIELALPYTPGRIVAFDGAVPHAVRPQSSAAPGFRFTLALFFNRKAAAK